MLTREEVALGYGYILGREPESEEVIALHQKSYDSIGKFRKALLNSPEFISAGYSNRKLLQMFYEDFTFFVDPGEPDFGRAISDVNYRYEAHNLRLLREILRPGDTYVDVGANIGILSLAARTVVGERGRVICFEPMADNAALLVRSIIANDFNNIVVYPVALSDAVRTLYLEGHSNGMLISNGRPERKITTAVGDTYLAKEDRVDFLKMDIEGHEPFAFRGLKNTIRKHKPMILCEFNPSMLKLTSKSDPSAYADQIFSMTNEVQAIDYNGQMTSVSDTASLLALCEVKNRYFVEQGLILDGILHMDLLFKAGRGEGRLTNILPKFGSARARRHRA
ncbi:MAG: FkbM family methyltransferase [Alphaproteobacteria bacterium]|nr:FkbM family methyltransferase [Alphaproteobacteria bacterium]